MHTRTYGDTTFIYNSDLSGEVEIKRDGEGLLVPGSDLLGFALNWLVSERIASLEAMDSSEILRAWRSP